MKKGYVGFGYNQSDNYFYVLIDKDKKKEVCVYERYGHNAGEQEIVDESDILKLKISRQKWGKLALGVTKEFNTRLKAEKKPVGKFAVGRTPVEKLLGKELMVLLWGIENADPKQIDTALRNWLGLKPEERWWLYTMTNASTGNINDKNGWRSALRYALCENPISGPREQTFGEFLGGRF